MKDLILKIKELSRKEGLAGAKEIEFLIEQKLKKDPNNTDLLLRLAVLEMDPPFSDECKSIECLEKILEIEKNNIKALLLLAYVKYHCSSGVDKDLFDRLNSVLIDDKELMSMSKYAASWFYGNNDKNKDEKKQEQYLLESINFYEGHVWNYVYLSELYLKNGKNKKIKELIEKALKNVMKIYDEKIHLDDITDIDEFLNGRIKGIFIPEGNFEWIKSLAK